VRTVAEVWNGDASEDGGDERGGAFELGVFVRMPAATFVAAARGRSLGLQGREALRTFPGEKVTFLVEGLDRHLRAEAAERSAYFRANAASPFGTSASQPSEAPAPLRPLNKHALFADLDTLPHPCRLQVLETATLGETTSVLVGLLYEAATRPYRPHPLFQRFCAAASKVHSSSRRASAAPRFAQMLCAIRGLTLETALAIAATYPSPRALIAAFRHAAVDGSTPSLLLHRTCTVPSASSGVQRPIPKALSERIHFFFTTTDANELMP